MGRRRIRVRLGAPQRKDTGTVVLQQPCATWSRLLATPRPLGMVRWWGRSIQQPDPTISGIGCCCPNLLARKESGDSVLQSARNRVLSFSSLATQYRSTSCSCQYLCMIMHILLLLLFCLGGSRRPGGGTVVLARLFALGPHSRVVHSLRVDPVCLASGLGPEPEGVSSGCAGASCQAPSRECCSTRGLSPHPPPRTPPPAYPRA